jgi:flagellar basal body-associated protein FliL
MTRPGDPPTPQPSQPQQFGQAPYPPPTKKKHGPSFWILIALGVIVLIALGSCAVALIGGARQVAKDLSNTSSVEATQAAAPAWRLRMLAGQRAQRDRQSVPVMEVFLIVAQLTIVVELGIIIGLLRPR